ncbi:hypothetical protein HYU45_04310 [Candidatus Daviesbacteria bacterium]|nr:hypothetical protein [Candidatus Daviesbacteria bacterium]
METRTPEHVSHIPHIPLPDIRGGLRWARNHWQPVGISLAIMAGGVYLIAVHDRGPQSSVRPTTEASDPFNPVEPVGVIIPAMPIETPTHIATAPPTPEPTTPEPVKTVKDVINNQTPNLVDLPPNEVQKIVDEAKAKGETVIALPDLVKSDGVEVTQFKSKKVGTQGLVITAPSGKYELPALTGGKVSVLIVGPNNTVNEIAISVGNDQDWFIIIPPSATSTLKVGQEVTAGQTLLSFDHDPESKAGQIFQNFLQGQITTNPNNTMALVGLAKTGNINSGVNLGFQQLAKDNQNNVAVISNK